MGKRKRDPDEVPTKKAKLELKQQSLLPILFGGRICYINDTERCQEFAKKLQMERFVGFDIEWRATFTKGKAQEKAALIQLARPGEVYLFHVKHYEMSDGLRYVLESRDCIKVGVGIRGDMIKLSKDYDIQYDPLGFRNLNEVYNTKLPECEQDNYSLANLTAALCNMELEKKKEIRCSNWGAEKLTEQQKLYAATDAWVGLKLWHIIRKIPTYDEEDSLILPQESVSETSEIVKLISNRGWECFEAVPRLDIKKRDVYNCWYHFGFTVDELCNLRNCSQNYAWYVIAYFVEKGFPYRFEQLRSGLGPIFGKACKAKNQLFPRDKTDYDYEDYKKIVDTLGIKESIEKAKVKISIAHLVRMHNERKDRSGCALHPAKAHELPKEKKQPKAMIKPTMQKAKSEPKFLKKSIIQKAKPIQASKTSGFVQTAKHEPKLLKKPTIQKSNLIRASKTPVSTSKKSAKKPLTKTSTKKSGFPVGHKIKKIVGKSGTRFKTSLKKSAPKSQIQNKPTFKSQDTVSNLKANTKPKAAKKFSAPKAKVIKMHSTAEREHKISIEKGAGKSNKFPRSKLLVQVEENRKIPVVSSLTAKSMKASKPCFGKLGKSKKRFGKKKQEGPGAHKSKRKRFGKSVRPVQKKLPIIRKENTVK